MNEVTSQNFSKVYPHLEATLRNANFIAIDGEFTGIGVDHVRNSLFDSMKERYEKQRDVIQPYISVQFGVTAFQRVPDKNEYTAEAFNFFLLPRSTPWNTRQFKWQTAALEFLATYEFDFNKLMHDGISYLDEADEATLRRQLRENVLLQNVERNMPSREDYNAHKDNINNITKWLSDETCSEDSVKINTRTVFLQYLMHKELRNRFPNVWTLSGNNNSIIVMKVAPNAKMILEKEEGSILEDAMLDSYIGFSKVFKLLVALKKPIIGHNTFLDFMFMHQQFYKPLPTKYSEFKANVHQLFPTIFDTKFLSYKLMELLQANEMWKSNSLSGLVDYFTGQHMTLGSPIVKFATPSDSRDDTTIQPKYHTAGWDAYFTGYVFVKILHVIATKHFEQNLAMKYFTHTELMSSVRDYANSVNIILGNTFYMRFDGPDPKSTRPKWLYVRMLAPESMIAYQIIEKMSRFGPVDVKQYTSKRMLVAVANHRSAREILQHFQQNKDIYVAPYNPILHSRSLQIFLWSSLVVSGGIFAWMLHKKLQRSS